MTKEAAALSFWTKSIQLRRGLKDPDDKEKYRLFVIQPAINNSTDPHERHLLSRLG